MFALGEFTGRWKVKSLVLGAFALWLVILSLGCKNKSQEDWASWIEIEAATESWGDREFVSELRRRRIGTPSRVLLQIPRTVWSDSQRQAAVRAADLALSEGFELRGNPVVDITQPIDWGRNPKADRNWHFQINALRPIQAVLEGFSATRDQKYYDVLRAVMLDWIDYNIVRNAANKMKWYDMAAGQRAVTLATILDSELRQSESEDQATKLLVQAASLHLRWLQDPKHLPEGNHAIFMMMGLKALTTLIPELRGSREASNYANRQLAALLETQYSSEQWHVEDSPGYHRFVTESFRRIVDSELFSDLPELQLTVDGALAHYHETFHPNGDAVLVGDSEASAKTSGCWSSTPWLLPRSKTTFSGLVSTKSSVFRKPKLA